MSLRYMVSIATEGIGDTRKIGSDLSRYRKKYKNLTKYIYRDK